MIFVFEHSNYNIQNNQLIQCAYGSDNFKHMQMICSKSHHVGILLNDFMRLERITKLFRKMNLVAFVHFSTFSVKSCGIEKHFISAKWNDELKKKNENNGNGKFSWNWDWNVQFSRYALVFALPTKENSVTAISMLHLLFARCDCSFPWIEISIRRKFVVNNRSSLALSLLRA